MYVKLEDLIAWAYWTWNFNFEDIQTDLMDVINHVIKDGITHIIRPNGKVLSLLDYDINDIVDYLYDDAIEVLQEIKDTEVEP